MSSDSYAPLELELLDEGLPEAVTAWRYRSLCAGSPVPFCYEGYLEHNFYSLDAIATAAGETLAVADAIAQARDLSGDGWSVLELPSSVARWLDEGLLTTGSGIESFYREVSRRLSDMAESLDHDEWVMSIFGP